MRSIILLLSFVIPMCFVNAANSQLNITINGFANSEGENMLFRGYNNVFDIESEGEEFEYTIETNNIISTQVGISENPKVKRYFIKVSEGKMGSFIFRKKGEKEVFLTVKCKISNLPDPIIFIGDVSAGDTVRSSTQRIFKLAYPEGVRLKNSNEIIRIQIYALNKTPRSCACDSLTNEMKELIDSLEGGQGFSISCKAVGSDGITRVYGASFDIE